MTSFVGTAKNLSARLYSVSTTHSADEAGVSSLREIVVHLRKNLERALAELSDS